MSAADPEHIAFACLAQLLFDISDTVDRIGSNPLEWHSRGYGACDHCRRKLWFGRKACVGRHVCGFQTIGIVGPFLRKIQRAIDERMAMTRKVGSEDADLAICNLACRTSVLPRHTARRLALLEKAGLVDDEDRIVICQMLDDIVADNIAQGIGIPIPATKDRLLPPWTRIASCLRAHPTGLALLIAEQTLQKKACVPRNTFLPEQRTYPLLNLPKRRRPQRKRLFNRRCLRPRSSNHGCPWIQKSSERATVMLGDPRVVPSFRCTFLPDMPPSPTTGSPYIVSSNFTMPTWSSPHPNRLDTPKTHAIRSTRALTFAASLVYNCYGLSACSPPLDGSDWDTTQPPEAFTSRLSTGRSPFPTLDMTTTSIGLLCRRDLHPLEWQLASLH